MKEWRKMVSADLEEDEFMEKWKTLTKEHALENDKDVEKLFDKRKEWAHAYLRSNFFAGISTTSRCEGMNSYLGKYLSPSNNLLEFFNNYYQWTRDMREEEFKLDYDSHRGGSDGGVLESSENNEYENIKDPENVKAKGSGAVRGTDKSRRYGNCKKKTNVHSNNTKNNGPPVANAVSKNAKKRLQLTKATQNRSEVCTTTTDDDEVDDVMCTHCRQYGHDIIICGNEYKEDDSNDDDYSTELEERKQQHNTPTSNNVHETATIETNEFEIIEDLPNVKAKGSGAVRGTGKSRRCGNCKYVQNKTNAKSDNTKNNRPPIAKEVPQNTKVLIS
ncbi:Protein FAR1-RELATED SEQUENCE 4 [Linum grandiflorum]